MLVRASLLRQSHPSDRFVPGKVVKVVDGSTLRRVACDNGEELWCTHNSGHMRADTRLAANTRLKALQTDGGTSILAQLKLHDDMNLGRRCVPMSWWQAMGSPQSLDWSTMRAGEVIQLWDALCKRPIPSDNDARQALITVMLLPEYVTERQWRKALFDACAYSRKSRRPRHPIANVIS